MSEQFKRYRCQLALPGFEVATQQSLQRARVVVIGMGGLGCPTAQYLTGTGIGNIGLVDYDIVAASNLHRQLLYTPEEAGRKKCMVAASKLQSQNPTIQVQAIDLRVERHNILNLINDYDIIVDCTDNFETRYLINDGCVILGKPLVYGAIYQYDGQIAVWNVRNDNGTYSPNFRDLFPNVNQGAVPNCAEGGVIPTLAGIIGCMQANEVIKYVTKSPQLLKSKLLVFDAMTLQTRVIRLSRETKTNITVLPPYKSMPYITASELIAKQKEECIELVDVRTAEEHRSFNIGGKNIPLSQLEERFAGVMNKEVVFYCTSGRRSEEAVRMISHRFPESKIYMLAGGVKDWSY